MGVWVMFLHISHHIVRLFVGFFQVSSIYSQNDHPVTDTWEPVPIASHLSFCTKGTFAWSCRIHCFKKQRKTFSLGRRCPSGRMRGEGKHWFQVLTHRLRRPPYLEGIGLFFRWWILRLRPVAPRRMTALPEVFKFQIGVKGVISPVSEEQVLLTWLFLFVSSTKTEVGCVLLHISHHIFLGVTVFAHLSSIHSQNDHPVTDTWEFILFTSSMSFCMKGIHARSCRIQNRCEWIFQFHPVTNQFKPWSTRKNPSATLLHSIFLGYHFQHLVELAVVDSKPS